MPSISLRTIAPKKAFNSQVFRDEIQSVMRKRVAPAVKRLLESPAQQWEESAGIVTRYINEPNRIGVHLYSTNPIYNLVDVGAKPHIIEPRHSRSLRFRPGYRAATSPRSLAGRSAQRSGPVISANIVHHPGFDAREFYETTAQTYKRDFDKEMERAISAGAKAQ